MPIKTKVTTGDVTGGSTVTADMEDVPGSGGGQTFYAHVVFVAEAKNVKYKKASPKPYKKKNNATNVELYWRVLFSDKGRKRKIKVYLDCKRTAEGPTNYAWTVASDTTTPPSYDRFDASMGTYYHGRHCCPRRRR